MKWFDDMRVSLKILALAVIAAIALFSSAIRATACWMLRTTA